MLLYYKYKRKKYYLCKVKNKPPDPVKESSGFKTVRGDTILHSLLLDQSNSFYCFLLK